MNNLKLMLRQRTTLCPHNSALFNVRSRLKPKNGGGGLCCASSAPVLVFPPSQSTLPQLLLPQCAHSHKRLKVGLLLSQNTCIATVDTNHNTVRLV